MLETVLTSLQKMPFYSIALSAVVVFFIAISILTMFSQAKKKNRRTASLEKGKRRHGAL